MMAELIQYSQNNLLFLVGILLLLLGAVTNYFPPKKINHFYGYRTRNSMKSQQRWDFAQRYSAKFAFFLGFVLFLLSFVPLVIKFSKENKLIIELALLFVGFVFLFVATEKAIKKKFPNE